MSNYYPNHGDRNVALERCLKDILSLIKPSESDRIRRLNTIRELATYVGSLESLEGVVHNLKFIPNARVPLLIYESKYHGISCDVSIDNHMGQIKSKILLWIADMDERFRDMVLLTKEWAKAQNINDPKSGTLNSFSLCLLVIFHFQVFQRFHFLRVAASIFQTCEPAILPPLREIYGGNIVDDIAGTRFLTERHIQDACATNIARFRSQNFRRRNQSSLSELLISFFEKIEDPFEQPDNAARAVGMNKLRIISNAFTDAYYKLSSRPMILNRNSVIASLTRPHISSQLGLRTYVHHTTNGVRSHQSGIEYSGYATPEPIHDQFQTVLRLDRYRPSSSTSSTVPLQGQGAFNVQGRQTWRRRRPNR
ncbi:protein HESO1 [Cocos nucifera]|uniref:Protein HESO1 n=1 Tax=Cocos nucifera TaxID=13894 RepID=A0A8K0IS87_COCNU|nr:protein HESO1 [Cocos nucifera]